MSVSKACREKPSDFRATYIEVGKPGCESHYRAHWKTVDRWVDQEGKDGLRRERADYVKAARAKRNEPVPRPVVECQAFDSDDAAAACAFLRERQHGGWVTGHRGDGQYFVGIRLCTGAEIIERAVAKGMDSWYVEADMMNRLAMHDGVDEWVLERDLT